MTQVLHVSTLRQEEWKGPKRYVRLVIHDTLAELRKAAAKHNPHQDWSDVGACYHAPVRREKYDMTTDKWVDITNLHFGGTIRMCRQYMHSEVITHECVHAACTIYRMDVSKRVDLDTGCHTAEEDLAYIIGDLTSGSLDVLFHAGLWPSALMEER